MLIQMTDGEARLHAAWLYYFGESTPVTRTLAFFRARKGKYPPLMCVR